MYAERGANPSASSRSRPQPLSFVKDSRFQLNGEVVFAAGAQSVPYGDLHSGYGGNLAERATQDAADEDFDSSNVFHGARGAGAPSPADSLWPRQIFLTSNGRIVGKLCLSTSTCRLPWPLHRYLSSRGQGACESSAAFSNFFSRTNGEVTKGNRVPIRERQTLHSLEMPSQTRCCHGSISPWRLLRTLIASKYAPLNAPRKRAGRLFVRSHPLARSVTGKR